MNGDAPKMRSAVWFEPRLRAEVSYAEIVEGRLRAPSWRRVVTLPPALLEALRAHIESVTLEGSVKEWTTEQRQLVFPNSRGRITHHGQFHELVWRPLLKAAGLPYRKYHATRHSTATWLLEDGADIRWVSQQLGHASIAQTVDTYGHCVPERHEAAAAKLDQYLTETQRRVGLIHRPAGRWPFRPVVRSGRRHDLQHFRNIEGKRRVSD